MLANITVVGAGLAGCEAAWQLAIRGHKVQLIDIKPAKKLAAFHDDNFAELVCSNSLKANDILIANGLLKEELRLLGSLLIKTADENAVAAGNALAVNRNHFAVKVTQAIKNHPNITCIIKEQTSIPDGICIISTGPLTEGELFISIGNLCGQPMHFFDAASPIVIENSIDFSAAFYGSRYNKGTPDYINCYLTQEEYLQFWQELVNAKTAQLHDFENSAVFEGCMPIEVMAKRGVDTLRFGPFKPVGLYDSNNGKRHYAVLQLRRENKEGTIFNLVGCQTNLLFSEQKRIFSLIKALKNAEFVRYGVMHRNSYINSPLVLNNSLQLKSNPNVYFAGQITGVEGYVESIAMGLVAALNIHGSICGKSPFPADNHTMTGALINYITDQSVTNFQPMNANFGIMGHIQHNVKDKKDKKLKLAERSISLIKEYSAVSAGDEES